MRSKNLLVAMAMATVMIATLLIFAPSMMADSLVKTLTFSWDPYEDIDRSGLEFRIYWSDYAGGPYTDENNLLAVIPKENIGDNVEPIDSTVYGPAETTVTKYFVARACGDTLQQDGTTAVECSENSNEISHDFWIPFSGYKVPINFRIVPQEPQE